MQPFRTIHLQISGVCNAKCPYCAAGNGSQPQGGFMDPVLFKVILNRLMELGLAEKGFTTLALYNWGEPLLHPEINKFIDTINETGLKYAFSTNASVVPKIEAAFTKNLDLVIISMPGFSQSSYDKIHGFNFPTIKKNISDLATALRKKGYSGEIRISYHVYQFNLEEMVACAEFCKSIGVNFFPFYASILDWWLLIDYFDNTISVEKLKEISKDIFMRYIINDQVCDIDKIEKCPMIDNFLIINEYGTVVSCCNLPINHPDYSCGNILKDDITDILREKASKEVCNECLKRGYFSGPLRVPGFYYQLANIK